MSFALPARQVTFGRPTHAPLQVPQPQQTQYQSQPLPQATQQYQSQPQPTQPTSNGLALPYSAPHLPGPAAGLALPGPAPAAPTYSSQPQPTQVQTAQLSQAQSPTLVGPSQSLAGPSTPGPSVVPATPAPLTLEQQHITAVEGIVPTLQNIVATVNLDCRLDLKTIALHARNAEYNPKVCTFRYSLV